RFYQDFSGYRDLGAMQIGYRTYFGRYQEGPLESPFSGNLIDLCPTGVYTDKPSRFKGRRWDYQRGPSLCIHCSLGCHTIASARYREMIRLEARFSESVNGYFICDRGRYGFAYANHPERPRRARIGGEEVPWDQAIQTAAERLRKTVQRGGPNSIACLSSSRSSLEAQGMLKHLCQIQEWKRPLYFGDSAIAHKLKNTASRLVEPLAISMREIEKADFIISVGADPINEAPMLALAMRQAFRDGADVAVIDPRPISLPFEFDHLPISLSDTDLLISFLVKGSVSRSSVESLGAEALSFYDAIPSESPFDPLINDRLSRLVPKLQQSRRPALVCGTDIVCETTPEVAADNALLLWATKERAGLFYVMPGPNAFGAALLSSGKQSLMEMVEEIEGGSIRGLILVESDPLLSFPDRKRLEQAIEKLELLLVLDYLNSSSARVAHVLLPTLSLFEVESTFVNQEGRVQSSRKIHAGGIPVAEISAGNHPPRTFRNDIPGGEPRPAWQILTELTHALSSAPQMPINDVWAWLGQENPAFANGRPQDGIRLRAGRDGRNPFSLDWLKDRKGTPPLPDSLELLLVDWTFGTEELSGYSQTLQQVEKPPSLSLHPKDAMRLGLKDRERVTLQLDDGPLEIEVRISEDMASGFMVLPRHRQIEWQRIKKFPVRIPFDRIKKIQYALSRRQ
ncbi:MAG: molybdopterin oxidoreductase family protein, partial [Thermodesulfobacteriota bacterium]